MGAKIRGSDGKEYVVYMGSYGIGPTRLVPAIIEASHDEKGIIWPDSVAPFNAIIINIKVGDEACDNACEKLYSTLIKAGKDILLDDVDNRVGTKFAVADLIGVPIQIIVSPRLATFGEVEIKYRNTGVREKMTIESAINRFVD